MYLLLVGKMFMNCWPVIAEIVLNWAYLHTLSDRQTGLSCGLYCAFCSHGYLLHGHQFQQSLKLLAFRKWWHVPTFSCVDLYQLFHLGSFFSEDEALPVPPIEDVTMADKTPPPDSEQEQGPVQKMPEQHAAKMAQKIYQALMKQILPDLDRVLRGKVVALFGFDLNCSQEMFYPFWGWCKSIIFSVILVCEIFFSIFIWTVQLLNLLVCKKAQFSAVFTSKKISQISQNFSNFMIM